MGFYQSLLSSVCWNYSEVWTYKDEEQHNGAAVTEVFVECLILVPITGIDECWGRTSYINASVISGCCKHSSSAAVDNIHYSQMHRSKFQDTFQDCAERTKVANTGYNTRVWYL